MIPPKEDGSGGVIYAAVNQTESGYYISIWSQKKTVWVRLLNRYGERRTATQAIIDYGWTLWETLTPPHQHRNTRRLGHG
jgi:hypothetical protein